MNRDEGKAATNMSSRDLVELGRAYGGAHGRIDGNWEGKEGKERAQHSNTYVAQCKLSHLWSNNYKSPLMDSKGVHVAPLNASNYYWVVWVVPFSFPTVIQH